MNIACNDLWTRNTGVVYGPPHHFCLSVTFHTLLVNVLCINLAWQYMFGIARRVQLQHPIGASKMNRLLFTLTVVVLMAAHCEYCTTLEYELQPYLSRNFVSH